MAAKTIMHDELTGVTLALKDDETTELMTVLINGHEVLVPEEMHSDLYAVASQLQGMMRNIKLEVVGTGANLEHTQTYREFNEAVYMFTEEHKFTK